MKPLLRRYFSMRPTLLCAATGGKGRHDFGSLGKEFRRMTRDVGHSESNRLPQNRFGFDSRRRNDRCCRRCILLLAALFVGVIRDLRYERMENASRPRSLQSAWLSAPTMIEAPTLITPAELGHTNCIAIGCQAGTICCGRTFGYS
jgi:hypothetical protein